MLMEIQGEPWLQLFLKHFWQVTPVHQAEELVPGARAASALW